MSALYELLEDKQGFLDTMNGLGLPGVKLEAQNAVSCGIAGTHMKVTVHGQEECAHDHEGHAHGHHHATRQHIGELIDTLNLPKKAAQHAKAVYDAIAAAEAKAHNCPVGEVHFHEVGALDAVADVAGVCYALCLIRPDRIVVSPVHVGSGTVRCAHGVLPVPAPATAALLTGVPIYGGKIAGELCTPTGAALLTHFADSFGSMPVMAVEKCGYGIGTKTFEQANCVRAFLGEENQKAEGEILELVCNVDDMTPEALAFACRRLLQLGALDVYTVPGQMKKGRPGHVLTLLCNTGQEETFAAHILEQTTTNGLRVRRCGKYFLKPAVDEVETKWGPVRVKRAEGYGIVHKKPEYDDVASLAVKNGLPYQKVYEEALKKWREENEK